MLHHTIDRGPARDVLDHIRRVESEVALDVWLSEMEAIAALPPEILDANIRRLQDKQTHAEAELAALRVYARAAKEMARV